MLLYSRANESMFAGLPCSLTTIVSEDSDILPLQGRFRDRLIMNNALFALLSKFRRIQEYMDCICM